MLETWVSRVVHPRDFGVADDRELGLFVHWDFVDAAAARRDDVCRYTSGNSAANSLAAPIGSYYNRRVCTWT